MEQTQIKTKIIPSIYEKSCRSTTNPNGHSPPAYDYLVHHRGVLLKLDIFIKWSLILFTAYLAFELIRKILGGSLTDNEVIVGLLIANVGFTFHMHGKIEKFGANLDHHLQWHGSRARK
jgi:hypothetical protein